MKQPSFIQSVIILAILVILAVLLSYHYPNGHTFMMTPRGRYPSSTMNRRGQMPASNTNTTPSSVEPSQPSSSGQETATEQGSSKVNVEHDYGSRIVYQKNDALGEGAYNNDCKARGGTFNNCGSPCDPKATVCIQACAYTCEFR